ncbi:MAG: hypothetical protein KAX69_03465 [Chitinophagales bacterium]|jgi:hypothetical protein|nr:hypothetical protein [Chitinophagales bacterium]
MRKIDKDYDVILSTRYKAWLDNLEADNSKHALSRTYYNDVAMELYKCQQGVCAYTERYICPNELYQSSNWTDGKYVIQDEVEYKLVDHAGEMDHFDPDFKADKYWLWSNLFMIDSTINSRKSNNSVVKYLKPDLVDYTPEKYFDYDDKTNRFIPKVEIDNDKTRNEIQYMIDNVLFLNHGVIKNDRRDFINDIKMKIKNGTQYKIDRFFTAINWCLGV